MSVNENDVENVDDDNNDSNGDSNGNDNSNGNNDSNSNGNDSNGNGNDSNGNDSNGNNDSNGGNDSNDSKGSNDSNDNNGNGGGNGIIAALYGGVCGAVAAAFPCCAVYTSPVRQGAVKPCFFISYRPPSSTDTARQRFTQKRLLGNRFIIKAGICAEYHGNADDRLEIADVSEMLFASLETVDIEGGLPLRAKKMHVDTAEGVLYFFADYEMFVYTESNADLMGQAEIFRTEFAF